MAPRGALTAGEIADLVHGDLVGHRDTQVVGVASLEEAGPDDLAFLASTSYLPYFRATHAGAVLVAPQFRDLSTGPATRIVVDDPRTALRAVIDALQPVEVECWGIHASVKIGKGVQWQERILIGPGAIVGARVRLGEGCRIGSHVMIAEDAVLGSGCRIDAYAFIGPGAVLGDRVIVKPGARVGTPGFAFVGTLDGPEPVRHVGGCRIESDVEVGANTTIDRGSVGTTVVGSRTKIDNLVQIAHNVRIGARCVIMAQAGIAGTTLIGDDVIIAGQAGLAGQLQVGDQARIAAQSGVIGDISGGASVSGYPARDHRSVLRQAVALRRLTPLVSRLERVAAHYDDSK